MRIIAVLKDPDLQWFKTSLEVMGVEGASLSVFSDDREALRSLPRGPRPDLFVLDIDIEGVQGLETIRVLRRKGEENPIPIIAISAKDVAVISLSAAKVKFLLKPVRLGDWKEALLGCIPPTTAGRKPSVIPPPSPPPPSPPKPAQVEQRRAAHAPCAIAHANMRFKGVLTEVTQTGIHVALGDELPLNANVTIVVGIPGTEPLRAVQFKARVEGGRSGGYDLAFTEIDSSTRIFMSSMVTI
jgi:CheY-like chemotaxis protein